MSIKKVDIIKYFLAVNLHQLNNQKSDQYYIAHYYTSMMNISFVHHACNHSCLQRKKSRHDNAPTDDCSYEKIEIWKSKSTVMYR